jgi:hypothetical protein
MIQFEFHKVSKKDQRMIKVCPKNAQKIEDALLKTNGGARAYTITTFDKVEALAAQFELRLENAFLPLRYRAGAKAVVVSGGKVSNSYEFRRQATKIVLIRKSSAWYLNKIEVEKIYVEGGSKSLTLTEEQKLLAIDRFLKQI